MITITAKSPKEVFRASERTRELRRLRDVERSLERLIADAPQHLKTVRAQISALERANAAGGDRP